MLITLREALYRWEMQQPDPIFDMCWLLHVPSSTTQQVLQIKSRNHVYKEEEDQKNLNRYSPILLIFRKNFEPASYYTVIYNRGVENVF